jgi:leader peptidase (prepilin peptidase)/N-methyltransferase
MLRGRCSRCKSKISPQYALVELFTGVLFFLVFYKVIVSQGSGFSFSFGYHPVWYIWSIVYLLVQFSLLVIIFVYDFHHKIIPDGPMYTFIALAIVQLVIAYNSALFHTPALWALLAGPIFFAAFFLIWFVSRGRAMGFGDAKLVLGIGFFLGLAEGLSAIVLGFWIGALVSVLLIVLKSGDKRLTMKSEIPFAPFLIAGIILAYAFNLDLFSLHVFLHL